jgi:transmembrane sensor
MSPTPAAHSSYSDRQCREAADWFVIIRSEKTGTTEAVGAESIQAWLRWMDCEEGNRAAFDAVASAWHALPLSGLPGLPDDEELSADDYDGQQSVHTLPGTGSAGPMASDAPVIHARRVRRTRSRWLAAAAVLVVVVLGTLIAFDRPERPDGARAEEFATRTGEQLQITLSDGSRVWLGPRSKLLVAFEPGRRGIRLTQGEAFFSVRKDPERPFAVRSTGGEIVALGTAFNVRAGDTQVTVAVSEGIVSVTPAAELAVRTPASVRVATGQQLTFTAQEPLKSLAIVQSATTGERARWRDGILVYRDEPLREVVEDLRRYSDLQIEITDAALGELHYSGVIYHDALQEWLAALPESFPVTITKDGNREIISAR